MRIYSGITSYSTRITSYHTVLTAYRILMSIFLSNSYCSLILSKFISTVILFVALNDSFSIKKLNFIVGES